MVAEELDLSNLVKQTLFFRINTKGNMLWGKAYVLNEDDPIVCIGAANVQFVKFMCINLVVETFKS